MSAAADFLALHHGDGFVLPNAWDAGTARIFEQVGFEAIATTSAGIAFALGRPDASVDGDTMLEHVGRIVAAVSVPVTADLESGYGDVATTIKRAVDVGAVGGNIEDQVAGALLPLDEAVAHIAAARTAAPAGTFVLNARTDAYFYPAGGDPFAETIERAKRYLDVGADCIFVPGVDDADEIRRLAAAIPAPLNIVAGLAPTLRSAPELFALGAKRVSLGGGITRAALSFVERAARELLELGTLDFLDGATSYADFQRRFGS